MYKVGMPRADEATWDAGRVDFAPKTADRIRARERRVSKERTKRGHDACERDGRQAATCCQEDSLLRTAVLLQDRLGAAVALGWSHEQKVIVRWYP
ncbi:hypothetical protein MASR2M8_15320 [Opitutaceae bacterium]